MMKDFFLLSSKIKVLQTVITLILLVQISSQRIPNCHNGDEFYDNTCFNSLIHLDFCRDGQFTEDKDGNLFVLYSKDDEMNRLFYALNKNGASYFEGGPQKEFQIEPVGDDEIDYRGPSRIIILDNEDNNKKNLLSVNVKYFKYGLTELHQMGRNDISSSARITSDFWGLNEYDDSDAINSFKFPLLKIPNENKYFYIFSINYNVTIKKFEFSGPNLEDYQEINSINATDFNFNYYEGMLNGFLMENNNLLILFYLRFMEYVYQGTFSIIFFNSDNLEKINEEISFELSESYTMYFFKGLVLRDEYCAFIYYINYYNYDTGETLNFMALNISTLYYNSGKYGFNLKVRTTFDDLLEPDVMASDFIKINDKRLAFITTEYVSDINERRLIILLFDIKEDYTIIDNKKYYYAWMYNNPEVIETYIYNRFLAFSCSFQGPSDDGTYNSILAFFGYPKGIDQTINIIPYLNDKTHIGTEVGDNIFIYLMDYLTIENNIFEFIAIPKIKLVSMSPEILFFNIEGDQEIGPLRANSFFGEIHVLKENKYLTRTNEQLYYFDYQYIIRENDYTDEIDENNQSDKVYYGRINRITFNLCPTGECPPECLFDSYINKECIFTGTDSEIIEQVEAIINIYDDYSKVLSTELRKNVYVELTNDIKEKLLENDSHLPWLDLGECAQKIRNTLSLSDNIPLIILKYGTTSDLTYENYVTYKIYRGDNFAEIDLSICKDNNINAIGMIIEPKMKKNVANSVESMVDQGYNPFDINDKFYREICTPYDSPDGTDVLLDDREEYYYSSLNTITCPDNCNISSYPIDTKYLKCNCPIDEGETLNLKHMSGKNVANSFKTTLKNSNWKVMICYKLVFDKEIFAKNIGSILSLILFIIYVGFFVYYLFEGITPLQNNIAEMMTSEEEKKKEGEDIKKEKEKEKNHAVIAFKNPPKKNNSRNNDNKDKDSTGLTIVRKTNDIKIVELDNNKKRKVITNPGKEEKDFSEIKMKKDKIYTEGANLYRKKETEINNDEEKYKDMDDFQLNNLEYLEAYKYDKRSFLRVYWSVLKREHTILFTFVSRNDYNLFYVKIERFLILLCTQMFMNGLFFTDDTMHKATKTDDYNFVQQLPKIIFSIIGTHVIEVLLCYLSMTDSVMYEVNELAKRKYTEEIIGEKVNTMKRKLIAYFIVTFILFAFYWYFVSAFCAVYQNTQKIFLLDFLMGTLLGYIDPFILYLLKVLLRHLSIAKLSNKKGEIVYKISDLIPIF